MPSTTNRVLTHLLDRRCFIVDVRALGQRGDAATQPACCYLLLPARPSYADAKRLEHREDFTMDLPAVQQRGRGPNPSTPPLAGDLVAGQFAIAYRAALERVLNA